MFLRGLEGWHVVIIVGLLVVLFGARKLPDAARSVGQSLRIFKSEIKAARDDDVTTAEKFEGDDSPPGPDSTQIETSRDRDRDRDRDSERDRV